MNIQPRPISMQPSLETIKAEHNHLFMQRALSHYPAGTYMDMNNYLLVTFHKHERYSLDDSVYPLYRHVKYAAQPNQYFGPNAKVGMIAYFDYQSSRNGNSQPKSNLPSPDHCHAIIFARNSQESQDIANNLMRLNTKILPSLHILNVTSLKKSLQYVLSYAAKAFGHEHSGFGSTKFDPLILPYSDERRTIKKRMDAVLQNRLQKHTSIRNTLVLS